MKTNSLIHEASPYLLQHAHNPVDWYAWNDETLARAAREDKMLLISIGYAACHWCHVMEHESFEDDEVARIMNEHFICVKVDREERPDVDQIYMNAAYLINGNGGWPLNALALPDGRPFFAGTYFPKTRWIQVLTYFADWYQQERNKLEQQAANVARGINEIELVPKNKADISFSQSDLDASFSGIIKRVDRERGGMSGSIKFPMPSVWEFLLHYHYFTGNEPSLNAVNITLQWMASGGIYDQVGGGFSRYSTDPKWHIPHFEKMLYDNAQLISLYSHAFQVTRNPLYRNVVFETTGFIKRELLSPEGLFYSSLDADSEGEEGKYYVWTFAEINNLLKEDASLFCEYYHITSGGNWEHGKNIPECSMTAAGSIAKKYQLSEEVLAEKIKKLKQILLTERHKRIRPRTDDKVLTAWNMLMITGLLDAYKAFGAREYFDMARQCIDFYLNHILTENNAVYRNYKNNNAGIHGFLDDYAFFISALINFYQVSFNEKYLMKAKDLTDYVLGHFYDEGSGMFFYTDDKYSNLIARKMEVADNVIVSSNSEMAKNLFILSMYFDNTGYEEISLQMIKNVLEDIRKTPSYYSNWAMTMAQYVKRPYEIAIVGNEWKQKLSAMQQHYLPDAIFAGGSSEGKLPLLENKLADKRTLIYVCQNKTCKNPVEKAEDAFRHLL
ncbi:MAG TPA: thioredoxin domain-containing protein [Chitinophagaceae bacterium]|nr:thioredoxin domain-containing protein [Chitinophagaceae bacterium]